MTRIIHLTDQVKEIEHIWQVKNKEDLLLIYEYMGLFWNNENMCHSQIYKTDSHLCKIIRILGQCILTNYDDEIVFEIFSDRLHAWRVNCIKFHEFKRQFIFETSLLLVPLWFIVFDYY